MAFITKADDNKCYTCGKQCINVEFCSEGSEYTNSYSLSRNIRVKITANEEFWGFGGVLISGWATYTNGYYDFFDGHDEDHRASKTCNGVTYGPFRNEQRPDVFYRSVYDPDDGSVIEYKSNGISETFIEGKQRGGAEVYLIDRPKGLVKAVTSDKQSCGDQDPTQVFKTFPENFGWGNKINFNTKIYKNLSGAWRLSSIENCYPSGNLYIPSGYLVDCSGEERQNISSADRRYQDYEKTRVRGSGNSLYYNYQSGCRPDGAVAGRYEGYFPDETSISRSFFNNSAGFIKARLSYGSLDNPYPASGLKEGMQIGIRTDVSGEVFNNVYTIFNVNHIFDYTTVMLVGTSTGNAPLTPGMPTGEFSLNIGKSGHWTAFNTYDPQTCCGLSAYGVSDSGKILCPDIAYHADFRRVFNNPKNLRQSNRLAAYRYNYGVFGTIENIVGVENTQINDNFITKETIDNDIGDLALSYIRKDFTYPTMTGVMISGEMVYLPVIIDYNLLELVVPTGDWEGSGVALFERELPYYGEFFVTDLYDAKSVSNYRSPTRDVNQINRGRASNATCYSKNATLEIFPDCITQYDKYEICDGGGQDAYVTNRIPRLAFVYRGCDFNDRCEFDEYGRPLNNWKGEDHLPTGIEDLKRQLGGQEIHMFLNLGTAWGGRKPGVLCECNCEEGGNGYDPPKFVEINSPLTFPSFPNFDLNPSGYGCYDKRYQVAMYNRYEGGSFSGCDGYCDVLASSQYACMPRQPYVTYGYIMNLCGKKNRNRKDVITRAFAKLHQEKTYTHLSYTGEIDEPMYWEVEAPFPAPFSDASGIWGSGTTDRDDTGGVGQGFLQVAGSGYGYWGLADTNKQVIAPYFTTEEGRFRCRCDDPDTFRSFVGFSASGTWQNLIGSHNGWPTNKVPFLIELEVDDTCAGCVTPAMEGQNLNIEISGLPTEYIHNENHRYGHNYCAYTQNRFASGVFGTGIDAIRTAQMDKPDFSCSTGFDLDICGTSGLKARYSNHYAENTCGCADGFNTTMYPVYLEKTDIVLGWTSNKSGAGSGLVEISGCWNSGSSMFDVDYDIAVPGGYRVFAEFNLACPSNHIFLNEAKCPNIKYEENAVSALWAGANACSHNYPAKIGEGGNLQLKTDLYFIPDTNVRILKAISPQGLESIDFDGYTITRSDFEVGGIFGVCEGDTVYSYGCYIANPQPGKSAGFYGCTNVGCTGLTACNCPDAICDECGGPYGYDGKAPRVLPMNYQFNECYCLCSQPTILRKYTATSTGLVLIESASGACPTASEYWMSKSGLAPVMLMSGPPNPYLGSDVRGIISYDYHQWSHGVNEYATGIKYELYEPALPEEGNNYCSQLSANLGGTYRVVDCENTGCAIDNNVNSTTCGEPIYSFPNWFNQDGIIPGVFDDGIPVRKKKCSPEIAIVTKIDCVTGVLDNGNPLTEGLGKHYKLYVSREYHEHNRTWLEQITIDQDGESVDICVPTNVGAYQYNDGSTSGCHPMNYSLLSDTVTPVSSWPCSINPSSGLYVNQDYQYTNVGFSPISYAWNYFNLFFSSNFLPSVPSGTLVASIGRDENGQPDCTGTPLAIQNTGTVFNSGDYNDPLGYNGIFATTGTHSCVQDAAQCGGELWCNKAFFPRHSYKYNTRIAPFGSPSICTSNNEFDLGIEKGYAEPIGNIGGYAAVKDEQKLRFVDFCNDNLIQVALQDIDIDSEIIYVEDYLPLIGVIHPGWRFTADVKSCTVGGTGCQDKIPVHTDYTIAQGIHQPKTFTQNNFESMGYYLDSRGVTYFERVDDQDANIVYTGLRAASGIDQCLFNPFKILIDVECNTNRIPRKAFAFDDPIFLQGVQSWPAETCKGTFAPVRCGCDSTRCKYNLPPVQGGCQKFLITGYNTTAVSGFYKFCDDPSCGDDGCTFTCGDLTEGIYLNLPSTWDSTATTWHPDIFEEAYLDGELAQYGPCINSACPDNTELYTYAHSLSNTQWLRNKCNGRYYQVTSTGWVNLWQCAENQYLGKDPYSVLGNTACACKDPYNGLCDAEVACEDFSSCDCNPIVPNLTPQPGGYDNAEPTGLMLDCGCVGLPLDDEPCGTDSKIKWTITASE